MNCFQLVKSVLDELYDQIDGNDEAAKDKQIRNELSRLSSLYLNLSNGVQIDYSSPVTRFAYVFRYVTAHADFVAQLISANATLSSLFSSDAMVTCIGGGPGSDLVGILKYMDRSGSRQSLRCWIYDREVAWTECWSDLDAKLVVPFRISTYFQPFDATKALTWTQNKYLNSDLFTVVYFLSEVFRMRTQAEAFFSNLFQRAKPGARFLYVDNRSPEFYGWFDRMASEAGLRTCSSDSGEMQLGTEEQKVDLGPYLTRFASPKLRAAVAWRIVQKD